MGISSRNCSTWILNDNYEDQLDKGSALALSRPAKIKKINSCRISLDTPCFQFCSLPVLKVRGTWDPSGRSRYAVVAGGQQKCLTLGFKSLIQYVFSVIAGTGDRWSHVDPASSKARAPARHTRATAIGGMNCNRATHGAQKFVHKLWTRRGVLFWAYISNISLLLIRFL